MRHSISKIEFLSEQDQDTVRRFNEMIMEKRVLVTLDKDGKPFNRVHAISVSVWDARTLILWRDAVALDMDQHGNLMPFKGA